MSYTPLNALSLDTEEDASEAEKNDEVRSFGDLDMLKYEQSKSKSLVFIQDSQQKN